MIEVVFSDSEKDSMKIAKNYNEEAMRRGISGYIGRKPTKERIREIFLRVKQLEEIPEMC